MQHFPLDHYRLDAGYLPIDKTGADLLFQIISASYEKGPTVIS